MFTRDVSRNAARLLMRLARLARDTDGALNPAQWEALRYIALANRFSKSPAALAAYLGSTRGTVSQTLIVLERKGLVERSASGRDRRSIGLELTAEGRALLASDPMERLAGDLAEGAGNTIADLDAALRGALGAAVRQNGGRPFGMCRDCRHFSAGGTAAAGRPFRCALLDEPLSEADSGLICVEQEPA